ncbi:MAG: ferritin-like domain-containing protein [Fimbriiglobus sp.]
MPTFIKRNPKHWQPSDFELAEADLAEPLRHIAKTVCLLESRCDDYAEYLRAMLLDRSPEWVAAIDRWNFEECQHGEMLCLLSEAVDSEFTFSAFMARYTDLVKYHEPTGVSVRGSVGAEFVARCVVEALASTLYQVLADTAAHPTASRVFRILAQDEARHFAMFLKMLNEEAIRTGGFRFFTRCRKAVMRMLELGDEQIIVASAVVAGRDQAPIDLRMEGDLYLGPLYGLYRWRHLRYAARMLLLTVGLRPRRSLIEACTLGLWLGIQVRRTGATLRTRLRTWWPGRKAVLGLGR